MSCPSNFTVTTQLSVVSIKWTRSSLIFSTGDPKILWKAIVPKLMHVQCVAQKKHRIIRMSNKYSENKNSFDPAKIGISVANS